MPGLSDNSRWADTAVRYARHLVPTSFNITRSPNDELAVAVMRAVDSTARSEIRRRLETSSSHESRQRFLAGILRLNPRAILEFDRQPQWCRTRRLRVTANPNAYESADREVTVRNADYAASFHAGLCDELSSLVFTYLMRHGKGNIIRVGLEAGHPYRGVDPDHAFCVYGVRAPPEGVDLKDFYRNVGNWGADAVVADGWSLDWYAAPILLNEHSIDRYNVSTPLALATRERIAHYRGNLKIIDVHLASTSRSSPPFLRQDTLFDRHRDSRHRR